MSSPINRFAGRASRTTKFASAITLFAVAVTLSALPARNANAQAAYSFFAVSGGSTTSTLYQYNFTQAGAYVNRTNVNINGNSGTGNTGLNFVNGLANDDARANVYYRNGTDTGSTGSGGQNFHAYNRISQQQTLINYGSGVNLITNNIRFANAAYYDNAYWSIASATDDLYRVTFDFATNPSAPTYNAQLWLGNVNSGLNGAAADRGTDANEAMDFGDIAIDTSNGTLYGFATVGGTSEFFRGTIPTTAGGATTTLSGATVNVSRGSDALVQLALARRTNGTVGDRLFGAALSTGEFYDINLDTGVRGSAIAGIPVEGVTDITSGAPVVIPESNAGALLTVGGLIGMAGVRLRARRK